MANRIEIEVLTEPATKPNGRVIRLVRTNAYIELQESSDPKFSCALTSYYSENEVVRLGEGDFQTGVAKIGQAAFQEPDGYHFERISPDEIERTR